MSFAFESRQFRVQHGQTDLVVTATSAYEAGLFLWGNRPGIKPADVLVTELSDHAQ